MSYRPKVKNSQGVAQDLPLDAETLKGTSSYVKYDTNSQGLTSTQKENARVNIGAGTYSKPVAGIPSTDLANSYAGSSTSGGPARSVSFLTTAPTEDNLDGIKFVELTSEPAEYYDGYYYVIHQS